MLRFQKKHSSTTVRGIIGCLKIEECGVCNNYFCCSDGFKDHTTSMWSKRMRERTFWDLNYVRLNISKSTFIRSYSVRQLLGRVGGLGENNILNFYAIKFSVEIALNVWRVIIVELSIVNFKISWISFYQHGTGGNLIDRRNWWEAIDIGEHKLLKVNIG